MKKLTKQEIEKLRHLTSSQKSCLAVENIEYYENITKKNFSKKISNIRTGKANDNEKTLNTLQTLSKIFAVSERYISDAKRLHKENKDLFELVKIGKLTLNDAVYSGNRGGICAYVIGADELPFVKIGQTKNIKLRLVSLQTALPYEIKIYHIIKDMTEAELHSQYKSFHYRGEWFKKEVLNHINQKQLFIGVA